MKGELPACGGDVISPGLSNEHGKPTSGELVLEARYVSHVGRAKRRGVNRIHRDEVDLHRDATKQLDHLFGIPRRIVDPLDEGVHDGDPLSLR